MKLVFFLTLLVGISLEDSAVPESNFALDTGKFSVSLYQKVVGDGQDNVLISPVSVQTALGVVYMGADGATAESMSRVMHLDRNANAVGDSYKALLDHHAETGSVKIANKMFLDKKYSLRPEFLSLVSEKFYSSAETLDTTDGPNTARVINAWVEAKTNNKIRHLVTPDDIENSTSVLVNAVYFKADWSNPFLKGTFKRSFWVSHNHTKEVDMMTQEAIFRFGDFHDFQAISMPYTWTDMSMLVLLPRENYGLRDLESRLNTMDIKYLVGGLMRQNVAVSLPKFKVEFEVKLKNVLVEMGMEEMFTDYADFSKMSVEPMKLSDVIHKAVLEVDEEGTEPSVSTVIPVAIPNEIYYPPKPFIANHPFLYLLADSDGHIFFMGRYVK